MSSIAKDHIRRIREVLTIPINSPATFNEVKNLCAYEEGVAERAQEIGKNSTLPVAIAAAEEFHKEFEAFYPLLKKLQDKVKKAAKEYEVR